MRSRSAYAPSSPWTTASRPPSPRLAKLEPRSSLRTPFDQDVDRLDLDERIAA
jgi:hypothetical protein